MDKKKRRDLERRLLDKAEEVTVALKAATCVDDVVFALGSLAPLIFPLRSPPTSSDLDGCYVDQVSSLSFPSVGGDTEECRDAFYWAPAFPVLAWVLLLDVASNWLPCFPFFAREQLFDVFFVDGVASEVVQVLVPFLQPRGNDSLDVRRGKFW